MNKLFLITTVALTMLFSSCNGQTNKSKKESVNTIQTKTNKSSSPFLWDKIDESTLETCNKISKEQFAKINKVMPILFKEYTKINEFDESLEYVYNDVDKFSPLILDFISVERVCCPAYTFYIKFSPNSKTVSLIIGGSKKIK